MTYQNLCEKGRKSLKKIQLNRAYQFWEKVQKLPENEAFHMGPEGVRNRKKTPIFFVDAKLSQIAQGFQKCKF